MKALRFAAVLAGMAVVLAAAPAFASIFTLYYCNTPNMGPREYTFTLQLDNHDGTWTPGYGIGWIVFGDAFQQASPIQDFVGDSSSFPVGPWTEFGVTGNGDHNGINLAPVSNPTPPYAPVYWVPAAIGDTITWRGFSSVDVPAGEMFWSALLVTSGTAPSFEVGITNCGAVCGSADFNCDGDAGTDEDIEAFFACVAGNCPPPPCTSSADFNGDGELPPTATSSHSSGSLRVAPAEQRRNTMSMFTTAPWLHPGLFLAPATTSA